MGYTWDNKGSASNLSFTFGNYVYTYDSLNNVLVHTGDTNTTRTHDLMFIFNNLQNATIENNSLKVYVRHYKLR